MAESPRTSSARAILDYLVREGPRVAFFRALSLIERALPEAPQPGQDGPPHLEQVRIRPSLSMSCPPCDVESIEPTDRGLCINVTFLGLYGVDTPLPYLYSERLLQTASDSSGKRVRAFLDIIHHRLYSLLYRAWRKSRPIVSTRRHVDPLHDRILALLGYSEALGLGLFQKGPEGDIRRPRLHEARLRVLRARTAAGLQTLLRYRVTPPATVEQFEQRWTPVDLQQRTRLGAQNASIGSSYLVGARVCDRNKISLKFSAQRFGEFEALLPEGRARHEVDDAMSGYLRDPLDYQLDVTLPTKEVPPWQLGRGGGLSRTIWLGLPRPYARMRWQGTPAPSVSRPTGQS